MASEFLRSLRGQRSQVQLARRLGYRGNPITDWECGERFPTATEALRVARLTGVNVAAAFARFAPNVPLTQNAEGFALAAWLAALRGKTPVSELAQRFGGSRFSVARWLSGRAQPRLPDFFRLLDALTARLPEWVAELVPIAQVPALLERYRAASSAKRLAFEEPWTEAVLRLLETSAYRQQRRERTRFIGRCLALPEAEVERCLLKLTQANVIEKRGARYVVKGQLTVDTKGGMQSLHDLKRHWAEVAAARLRSPHANDLFGYNLISVSAADLLRIREKLSEAFRDIRSLVAASQPEETAALVNLQLVTFSEPPTRT